MLSYSPLLISLHNRLRDTKKPLFPSPPRNPLTGGGAVASSSKIIIQRYFYSRNSQLLNIDDMCTNFLHNIWHLGLDTVPVLVGPVSYLLLSKPAKGVEKSFSFFPSLEIFFQEVVAELKAAGATWIQFDEPTLVKDLDSHQLQAFTHAYSELESSLSGLNVIIESYFADVPAEAYKTLTSLKGVAGYGFDLVCGTKTLDLIKSGFPSGKYLFAGVVDGRNIWANDLASSISTLEALEGIVGKDKVVVSTSCSLLHTAVDLVNEIKSWLAFAAQKVVEVNALAKVLSGHKDEAFFAANAAAQASRKSSTRVTNEHVQKSAAALKGSDNRRATNVSVRLDAQQKKLSLPVLPTTTIGSFPQTMDLRRVRREYKAKKSPKKIMSVRSRRRLTKLSSSKKSSTLMYNCYQIALAIKDEVEDFEKLGITVIQIDEAALREGLPLRKSERLSILMGRSPPSESPTVIHTTCCYSNFNGIIHSIINMDADVITIENSRSHEEALSVFREGVSMALALPWVYDIHHQGPICRRNRWTGAIRACCLWRTNILWGPTLMCDSRLANITEVKPALSNMVAACQASPLPLAQC
ncbi:hypothetical protein F8388_020542 [Cannabis sativa]|uniref:5-methyltetrahydropteroyltriglutamate--homocysteine S-methyltransferase n=1 Tax=Cannabis sativa TaxID=3483 RepID=A0A7J6EPF8_CANSA|nr:hypothetical protein F8388_020542 [Cannabis sativa]